MASAFAGCLMGKIRAGRNYCANLVVAETLSDKLRKSIRVMTVYDMDAVKLDLD
jgi:hypothetical protein